MDKIKLNDVMNKASIAIKLDGEDKLPEAYRGYLNCLLSIVEGLLQSTNTDVQIQVTKLVRQAVRVGQQSMDRVAALLSSIESEQSNSRLQENQPQQKQPAQYQSTQYQPLVNQPPNNLPSNIQSTQYEPLVNQPPHNQPPQDQATPEPQMQGYGSVHGPSSVGATSINTVVNQMDCPYIPPLPDDPECLPRKRMAKPIKSPLDVAHRHNQQLALSYKNRMGNMSQTASANLKLTLQRKMAENLAIARVREDAIIKRIRERQNRLEEEATRRFSALFGMSKEDQEYRLVYKKVLEYEQDAKWLISWRHKLQSQPKEPTVIRDLISEVLKCSDHPLTQLLKSYQFKVYERIYPLVAQNFKELDNILVPLNDVYWLSALDVCARSISARSVRASVKSTDPRNKVSNRSEHYVEKKVNVGCDTVNVGCDTVNLGCDTVNDITSSSNIESAESTDSVNTSEKSCVDQNAVNQTKNSTLCIKDGSSDRDNDSHDGQNGQLNPSVGDIAEHENMLKIIEAESDKIDEYDRTLTNRIGEVTYKGLSTTSDTEASALTDDVNENTITNGAENPKESLEDCDISTRSSVYNTTNRLSLEFLKAKQHEERTIKDIRKTTEEIYDEIMSSTDAIPDFALEASSLRNQSDASTHESTPSDFAIKFDNVSDDDFVKMTNDAYARHLNILKQDIHRYMEKLLVIFVVAFEELDSPEGRDLCYAYLEVPFFTPLWKYIRALFRLANLQKELCIAVAMSEYEHISPHEMAVKDQLCLHDDPEPYHTPIQQLHSFIAWATPLSKLESLVSVTQSICQDIDDYYSRDTISDTKPPIGADELMPIMSYVVLRSGLPQIVSECHALEEFVHEGYLMGEEGYCLTSIQTAANYVISLGERILQKRMSPTVDEQSC